MRNNSIYRISFYPPYVSSASSASEKCTIRMVICTLAHLHITPHVKPLKHTKNMRNFSQAGIDTGAAPAARYGPPAPNAKTPAPTPRTSRSPSTWTPDGATASTAKPISAYPTPTKNASANGASTASSASTKPSRPPGATYAPVSSRPTSTCPPPLPTTW